MPNLPPNPPEENPFASPREVSTRQPFVPSGSANLQSVLTISLLVLLSLFSGFLTFFVTCAVGVARLEGLFLVSPFVGILGGVGMAYTLFWLARGAGWIRRSWDREDLSGKRSSSAPESLKGVFFIVMTLFVLGPIILFGLALFDMPLVKSIFRDEKVLVVMLLPIFVVSALGLIGAIVALPRWLNRSESPPGRWPKI